MKEKETDCESFNSESPSKRGWFFYAPFIVVIDVCILGDCCCCISTRFILDCSNPPDLELEVQGIYVDPPFRQHKDEQNISSSWLCVSFLILGMVKALSLLRFQPRKVCFFFNKSFYINL